MANGIVASNGMRLLWTNPSPTSSFSAQTVSLDLSAYQAVVIIPKFTTSSGSMRKGAFLRIGEHTSCWEPDSGGRYIARNIRVNTDGVVFETGSNNGTNSAAHWITCYIYGIK